MSGSPATGTVCYYLGTRIGDRKRQLASTTLARAERCRQKFGQFPAVLMPANSLRGRLYAFSCLQQLRSFGVSARAEHADVSPLARTVRTL